jgi:hypothetical protein
LVSIIWSTSGIHGLLALAAGMRHDAEFFCPSVLRDTERNLWDGKRRMTSQGIYLHLVNAPSHSAKPLWQKIARTKTIMTFDW